MSPDLIDSVSDGWQLESEDPQIDRVTLLEMEMFDEDDYGDPADLAVPRTITADRLEPVRVVTDMTETTRQCEDCETPMKMYEVLYDLCRACAERIGQIRACDVFRGDV